MKTSELAGAALDWAVAKCEGVTVLPKMRGGCYVTLDRGETVLLCYSTNWSQGGPIIEREEINIIKRVGRPFCGFAYRYGKNKNLHGKTKCIITSVDGPTPLIAAMRCSVASKLGDVVEIPKELLINGESK